jgi:multicomponent K+:H+ antiporter subunit D
VAAPWLFPAALATAVLGAVAALGRRDLRRQLAGILVLSVGTLVAAVAPLRPDGVAAGLYYLAHSTFVAGALFLVAAALRAARVGPGAPAPAAAGVLFALGAVAAAGLPPLSGFVGKALILAAAPPGAAGWWLWAVVLGTSFVAVLALVRGGATHVWAGAGPGAPAGAAGAGDGAPARGPGLVLAAPAPLGPAAALVALLVALTAAAGPVSAYTDAAARQLLAAPDAAGGYVRAVLATPGGR